MPKMSSYDPAESIAGMARTGAPRVPVGNSAVAAVRNSSAASSAEFKVASKNGKSGNPTGGGKSNRGYGSVTGPAFGIRATFKPSAAPEAGRTQDNVRTIGSSINRPRTNFDAAR